jgi:O-antigen ligase
MDDTRHSSSSESRRRRDTSPLRKVLKVLELIGGGLLCALVVTTPWLYGTTEEWSVKLMNYGSYAAGMVFLIAGILRKIARREDYSSTGREKVPGWIFLILNISVLLFCAIAYWNARASFSVDDRSFTYREEYNPKLPTTYDAALTAETLAVLFACFVVFWSLRSWIAGGNRSRTDHDEGGILRNKRFQLFVWLLCINGLALAVQGILQRLSGSSKLLWVRESYWGTAISCFGPFSYRGNAAEYLNLLWPVAIGFWWILSRERRRRIGSSRLFTDGPELLLIPTTIAMIAACIISLSRGGAVIAVSILIGIAVVFLLQKNVSMSSRLGFGGFVLLVFLAVWFLGWENLAVRFKASGFDLSGRVEIYRNAKQMAHDYPIFGTGPGSFRSVYHLYRQGTEERWHGFLHDDWMETRVTFGWVGLGLVIGNLVVLAYWICSSGRPAILYVFTASVGLGLVGALIHAKFDFPFQTYSILFTFVAIAALLTTVSPTKK